MFFRVLLLPYYHFYIVLYNSFKIVKKICCYLFRAYYPYPESSSNFFYDSRIIFDFLTRIASIPPFYLLAKIFDDGFKFQFRFCCKSLRLEKVVNFRIPNFQIMFRFGRPIAFSSLLTSVIIFLANSSKMNHNNFSCLFSSIIIISYNSSTIKNKITNEFYII